MHYLLSLRGRNVFSKEQVISQYSVAALSSGRLDLELSWKRGKSLRLRRKGMSVGKLIHCMQWASAVYV
jgi:hypothetical protein